MMVSTYENADESFLTPFRLGDGLDPKTTIELRLISISQGIRSKKGWREKRKNEQIISKWEDEALAQGSSREEFQYVLDELDYYESLTDGSIEMSIIDGIWQADNAIDYNLKTAFTSAVSELLEDVSESEKDYHPDSDDLVIDLVHPSLFCFVYGVTKKTTFDAVPALFYLGAGDTSLVDGKNKYQWLPAEFHVGKNGKVSILSYINNLHPEKHARLYPLIAQIFEKFVPLFNRVLTDLKNPRPNRVEVDPDEWYEDYSSTDPDDEEPYVDWNNSRPIKWPTIGKFQPPPAPESVVDLKGKNIQVIVKLAKIELTPNKPEYQGGVWHVEGVESEYIVASGIYYYSSENISESKLKFRQAISEPHYSQDDARGVETFYDLKDKGPLNQYLGSVETMRDRLLAFPNVFQHRVAPFELVDRSKPGHRKILVFFLVDPNKQIISTKNVPPQQRSWFEQRLRNVQPFSYLPPHIFENIVGYLDWPMSLEDAKKYRRDLMSQRKYFRDEFEKEIFERPFSLCEH